MTLLDELPEAWRQILADILNSNDGRKLEQHLIDLLTQGAEIFPPRHAWFSALDDLTPAETRVVIIGQDPYHGKGQATGHAFAVMPAMKTPPSLRNIFKLIEVECGARVSSSADLSRLQRQGVMLLNSILTVASGSPRSHSKMGWQAVTDRVLEAVACDPNPTVFLLWGAEAQRKAELLKADHNLVLSGPHPSPLSAYRGFFDCGHLITANDFLTAKGCPAIDWLALS
ncbi:MAG: uracil-DNA glycosylase [Luminiphilus sp.]|nr:uracil-DNA glycosylase [Luminiphilus sp.]